MIAISSLDFDIDGAILFEENKSSTDYGKKSRRQNRIATLDGSAVLQDRGYSISDLTFRIGIKDYTQDSITRLAQLVEVFPTVRISCREGCFIGAIQNLSAESNNFDFLVVSNG